MKNSAVQWCACPSVSVVWKSPPASHSVWPAGNSGACKTFNKFNVLEVFGTLSGLRINTEKNTNMDREEKKILQRKIVEFEPSLGHNLLQYAGSNFVSGLG